MLRAAVVADARRVADIDRVAEERYRGICALGDLVAGRILVAECADRVCGFALYTLVLDEGSLNNIVVDSQCRGRGVGTELLRHTLGVMQQAGATRCLLEVRASNAAALALYKREGFTLDGRRPGYYPAGTGEREDALLMSKPL